MSAATTKREASIFHMRLPDEPSGLDVPTSVADALPDVYGYTPGRLAHDLLAVFAEPTGQPRRLKPVVGAWQRNSAQAPKPASAYSNLNVVGPANAKRLATAYWRSLHRLRRSDLRRVLLEQADGDARAAAQAFLDLISQEVEEHADTRHSPGGTAKAMAKAVAKAKGLEIPFMPPGGAGDSAGTGHPGLVAKTVRVAELARRLKLRYEPYSRRRWKTHEVPWPDEIDVVPLRSLSACDLTRITVADHLVSDAEFYARLARRDLRQTIYTEPEPAPPERFVMLLDVSGSMQGRTPAGYTRYEFAVASAVALLQAALSGGHEVVLIRFDAEPYPPLTGTPAEIVKALLDGEASGGGTSIAAALEAADAEHPSEIILITDGCDDRLASPPKAPLVTYIAGGHHEQLRQWSRSYVRIEEASR